MPQDLLKYGLIPEFVGRVPVVVSLEGLNEDTLIRILQEPRNALLKQYKKLFDFDGVELAFEPDAVQEIARQALERNTGARGLRAILEEIDPPFFFVKRLSSFVISFSIPALYLNTFIPDSTRGKKALYSGSSWHFVIVIMGNVADMMTALLPIMTKSLSPMLTSFALIIISFFDLSIL